MTSKVTITAVGGDVKVASIEISNQKYSQYGFEVAEFRHVERKHVVKDGESLTLHVWQDGPELSIREVKPKDQQSE